jgi:tetratricopeptide (TPR) repeat protein
MDILAIIGIAATIVGLIAGVIQVLEYLQKRREKSAHSPHPRSSDPAEHAHLTQLRHILTERFDEGELRTLCFDLGVDYDSLPDRGKANKARELVAYLERRDRILELIEMGQRLRPDIGAWAQARLDEGMERLRARRDRADRERRAMRERQRVVNLRPLDVTHTFKDRQREMQALCDYLADEGARLVSIVGRGGMGKTALACRVLADLERGVLPVSGEEKELTVDGILYLSARSTGLGLERIYTDVGRMLGEPAAGKLAVRWASQDTPLEAKVEHLLEALGDGLYLILLDNLEDVLTEEGVIAGEGLRLFVERCLTMPGGARLIVTSREEVKVAAGALRGVRSVPLREGLPVDEAVALLRDLDPSGALGLREGAEHDLRRAARLTRGIPRALEILAGILHEDPAANLVRLLANEGLFGEQVVEQLVTEGYRRLEEDERRVMEALAVFDRPVEETAVAYLLHPWFPDLDVRGGLRRLVSGYFVSASRMTGEYSLHPLDREYAYRQLSDNRESDVYTRRNLELRAADFYVRIRKPESEWESIDDLAPQLIEFEHRIQAGDYDGACRVLKPIDSDHLLRWDHYSRSCEMREKLQGQLTDPSLRADNLGGLGRAYHYLGQVERAIEFHEKALAITRAISDHAGTGRHLHNLGNACYSQGQIERAIELQEKALSIAREIGDRQAEGGPLGNLGLTYFSLGQIEQAIKHWKDALAIARETGSRWLEGTSLVNLGTAYRALGQVEQAIKLYEEALTVAYEINARWVKEISLGNLGSAYSASGRVKRAIKLYEEALIVAYEIGDRRKESVWLGSLARAYHNLGQVKQAIKLCEEALAIARETGDPREEGNRLGDLGNVYRDLGQVEQAVKFYKEALAVIRAIGHRRFEVNWLNNLGNAYYALGQVEQAIKLYQKALVISRETGYRLGNGYQLLELGRALLTAGQLSEARQHCTEALALEISEISYRAALTLGIILLHQSEATARDTFENAAARCETRLGWTAGLYKVRYALAAAMVGQAVCDPRWKDEDEHTKLLTPALTEYRRALEICAAPGVVADALRDLELIQAAGIEGLEPVFELLRTTDKEIHDP